jgi:type II secretory pathway pseudopilin PulG
MPIQTHKMAKHRNAQRGFTILELAIATVVLLVGIVSVVELVPASMQNNSNNRQSTMTTVIGQRILEQMALQPLKATAFVDSDGNALSLGAGVAGVAGSPLVAGSAQINFAAAAVPGYSLAYIDPNNPNTGTYDVRWAVVTTANAAGTITAKRFIVGARKLSVTGISLAVNFDTTVEQ